MNRFSFSNIERSRESFVMSLLDDSVSEGPGFSLMSPERKINRIRHMYNNEE